MMKQYLLYKDINSRSFFFENIVSGLAVLCHLYVVLFLVDKLLSLIGRRNKLEIATLGLSNK